MQRRGSRTPLSDAQYSVKRPWTKTGAQDILSKHWVALLCCEGDGPLEEIVQGDWNLLFGDLKKPPGHGPGHPALLE